MMKYATRISKGNKEMENEFLGYIRKHQKDVFGYETYGDGTEFFDEDGCVLFVVRETERGELAFRFTEIEDEFIIMNGETNKEYEDALQRKPSLV